MTKTLSTSGRVLMLREILSVTPSVSANREPGGSSTPSSARPESSCGMKPFGSRKKLPIEPMKIRMPRPTVLMRWRTDQPTMRV